MEHDADGFRGHHFADHRGAVLDFPPARAADDLAAVFAGGDPRLHARAGRLDLWLDQRGQPRLRRHSPWPRGGLRSGALPGSPRFARRHHSGITPGHPAQHILGGGYDHQRVPGSQLWRTARSGATGFAGRAGRDAFRAGDVVRFPCPRSSAIAASKSAGSANCASGAPAIATPGHGFSPEPGFHRHVGESMFGVTAALLLAAIASARPRFARDGSIAGRVATTPQSRLRRPR